ncbi:MAG: hypothetical protein HFH68_14375 [Lachnospiraceae bacterium]|nr:hypothetical protein [Lachnospiraceae bacterium]
MEYKVFKEVAKESIRDHLSEKFAYCQIDVKPVHKVNGTLDGLFVTEAGKQGVAVAPTVYLQELYESYKSTGNLEATLTAAASRLAEGLGHAREMAGMDFSEPETKLVLSLINTEQNRELLEAQEGEFIFHVEVGGGESNAKEEPV